MDQILNNVVTLIFDEYVAQLRNDLIHLTKQPKYTYTSLPSDIPMSGIYLFSEHDKPLYVGRSKNIKNRLAMHSRDSSTQQMASFAFRIARIETNFLDAVYDPKGNTRDNLISKNDDFFEAFLKAKRRVKTMDVQFMAVEEPIKQALLEIYVAVVLQTPFNEFKTS